MGLGFLFPSNLLPVPHRAVHAHRGWATGIVWHGGSELTGGWCACSASSSAMPPASSLRATSPGATPSAATRWCPKTPRPWSSRTRWRMRGALPHRVACQSDLLQTLFAVHASLRYSATCKPGACWRTVSHSPSASCRLCLCGQVPQQRVCIRRSGRPVLRGHAPGAPGNSPAVRGKQSAPHSKHGLRLHVRFRGDHRITGCRWPRTGTAWARCALRTRPRASLTPSAATS